jgi:hypothetical protein
MAKPRVIADSSEAMWADCVQIALMQREIGSAVFAFQRSLAARRAAMRAANHSGIVRLRTLDGEHAAATAAKSLADIELRGVVLAVAMRAGDEQAHGAELNVSKGKTLIILLLNRIGFRNLAI